MLEDQYKPDDEKEITYSKWESKLHHPGCSQSDIPALYYYCARA
jgi:hypothetical protein